MNKVFETINTEDIWEQFYVPLRGFVRRKVTSDQDAEDIIQNIFCTIHQNLNCLREKEKIRPWIYTIAKNSITDFFRKKNKDKILTELKEEIAAESDWESTENDEIAQCLKAMIGFLPENYREVIILTEFHNIKQKELGQRLGLSISGVKSRVKRAREKLKKMLINCCAFQFDKQGNITDYKKKCNINSDKNF